MRTLLLLLRFSWTVWCCRYRCRHCSFGAWGHSHRRDRSHSPSRVRSNRSHGRRPQSSRTKHKRRTGCSRNHTRTSQFRNNRYLRRPSYRDELRHPRLSQRVGQRQAMDANQRSALLPQNLSRILRCPRIRQTTKHRKLQDVTFIRQGLNSPSLAAFSIFRF